MEGSILTAAACLRAGTVQRPRALQEDEDFCVCVVGTGGLVPQPGPQRPRPRAARRRDGFLQVAAQEGETSLLLLLLDMFSAAGVMR